MAWRVLFHPAFDPEFAVLPEHVQDEMLAALVELRQTGPLTERPHVDHLKGSKYPNMKELRVSCADGAWRFAFAFDPKRQAIMLVGGNKSGISENLFYRRLIRRADQRYGDHLETS